MLMSSLFPVLMGLLLVEAAQVKYRAGLHFC